MYTHTGENIKRYCLKYRANFYAKYFFKHRFACTLNMNIVCPSSLKTCTVLTHFPYFLAAFHNLVYVPNTMIEGWGQRAKRKYLASSTENRTNFIIIDSLLSLEDWMTPKATISLLDPSRVTWSWQYIAIILMNVTLDEMVTQCTNAAQY